MGNKGYIYYKFLITNMTKENEKKKKKIFLPITYKLTWHLNFFIFQLQK